MYLHLENWSAAPLVVDKLGALGFPHEEKVIKVFASSEDLRQSLGKSALFVTEASGEPFGDDEMYEYVQRQPYSGAKLEHDLAQYGLTDDGSAAVRSLFRFSNEHGFCQAAMALQKDGRWAISHPYKSIDGIEAAIRNPKRVEAIHLDIFLPDSLRLLSKLVGIEEAPEAILDWREGVRRLTS